MKELEKEQSQDTLELIILYLEASDAALALIASYIDCVPSSTRMQRQQLTPLM